MRVFISWSGHASKQVADALRDWLPCVLQEVVPFMSAADVDKGARWNNELYGQLASAQAGIICLTKSNLTAPWLLFEAGAIAKTVEERTLACTYLFRLTPTDVKDPLAQFQATRAEREDTMKLIATLNKHLAAPLPQQRVEEVFNTWWPKLDPMLSTIDDGDKVYTQPRSVDDKINEVLSLVRQLVRDVPRSPLEKLRLARHYLEALDPQSRAALDALPDDLRTTVCLADAEGLSYEEIAAVMSVPLGTVRSRLYRGRQLLKKQFDSNEGSGEPRG